VTRDEVQAVIKDYERRVTLCRGAALEATTEQARAASTVAGLIWQNAAAELSAALHKSETAEEQRVRAQVRAACDAAGWERRAGDE
jgi:hypothetical protein